MSRTRTPSGPPDTPVPDPLASTPYKYVRPIGAGAMGEVVEAEHRELRKRVVVKLFNLRLAAPYSLAAMEDRFRLEAQALASLDGHPNIVQVSDCGRTLEGQLYLVMQKLEGRTLAEELEARGPVDPGEAVDLGSQVLAGLEVVHAAGLVHRDIKPSNLFLCDPPRPGGERVLKILDFGIVKLLAADLSARGPAPLAVPTAEGTVVGSPRYVAPEQALGRRVDGRADLYSVGAVLYALVTGKDPFHDERGVYEIMLAHISRPPTPPSALARFQMPTALDRAILKALAKNPEDRFATATEFREALARALSAPAPRWLATERLDASAFRGAVPGDAPRAEVPRDPDTELTLRRTPGDRALPVVETRDSATTVIRSDRARVDNGEPTPRTRRERVRALLVVGIVILIAVLAIVLRMLLALPTARGVG